VTKIKGVSIQSVWGTYSPFSPEKKKAPSFYFGGVMEVAIALTVIALTLFLFFDFVYRQYKHYCPMCKSDRVVTTRTKRWCRSCGAWWAL